MEVLISCDKNFNPLFLGLDQQLSVLQRVPATLKNRFHFMRGQVFAQGNWRSLIE